MRIFTVYFQVLLFLVLSISTTPLLGNNPETKFKENLPSPEFLVMPDTSCGLMDTLIQLTLPSCPGASDATATIQFEGNPDSLMIEWDNGVIGDTVTGLNAGLHFVTVTDNNSCMLIDSILIADKPIFDYSIQSTNSLCIGVSNGSITITDTINLSYSWSTGDSTNTLTNLGRGAYEVTISDGTGCAIAETEIVEVDTQATLQLTGTSATCLGINDGTAFANDTLNLAGYNYLWSTGDTVNSLSGINVGTYFVLATSPEGCLAADSINIEATRGVALEPTIVGTSCEGVSDGSIIINDTLDITGLQFGWSTGDTSQSISNLDTGTYSVAIVDSIGCIAGATFNITAGMPFEVDVTSTNATCEGVNDGTVTVNDTTGVNGLSILWNTGDTTQAISGLAPGVYSVTISDDNGCSNNASIQVNAGTVDEPTVEITNVSCAGLTDGSIIINGTVLDTTSVYTWNTGDSTNSLVNIGVGDYLVTITNGMGCISSDSIKVMANSSLNISLSGANETCSGLADGSATINDSIDITGLTFAWSHGDSTQIISNLSAGNYIVTVTDTVGCFAIDSILIEADSSLQIGLTGNNINCTDINDGRVGATVIGAATTDGLSFAWSTGDTTQSIDNLAPGDYEVTVTEASGCFGIGGVNLNEADSIDLVLRVSPLACMDTMGTGGILAVATGGSGNFTYAWSTGDSTDILNNLMAGTYSVTATDSLGCTVTDSATLATPPDLIVATSLTQAPTCAGTQDGSVAANISGGTSPYDIRWNTGIITSTLENLNPGTYSVEVSDDAGCMVTDSITIVGVTEITLTVSELSGASSQNTADASATVSATGGLAPYTFNWDNGAMGDTVTNLSPGNHEVVATDANGCTAIGSIAVSFFDLSVSIIETQNLNCNGNQNGRATASPNTGTAPFTYTWSTGDTIPILTNLPGGEHSVTVTDADGRKGTASVTLTEPAPINFNLEIIPPGCPTSANGRITINPTGTSTANPLYDFGVGVSTDPFILGVTSGTKRYGIIDGACRADTLFTIESISANPPLPAFDVESIGLNASFTDNTANDPFDYLWKFGDGSTSEEVNPVYQYPDTGNYEVTLIVSNACDTDSLTQSVRIAPIPVPGVELTFGRDTSSLSGQVVSIPVTVGAFEDLAGFSGTFEFTNPLIGEIQGVRDLNLPNLTEANIATQENLVSINWSVADTSQLVTLTAGTQIFVIDVLLTGGSDACTEIVGTNAESTLQFTKTFMGDLVPAPFVINSAEICIAATVSIAGNVSRAETGNVSGVTVSTNGDVSSTTMADGNYALPGLPGGATFNIDASKSDELLSGVTTFDLVAILQHILTQTPLNSPYKIIAADIDNSGSVSSLDLVHLQRLILQQIDAFPNNQPWRFVPETYVFSNPTNPLAESFPETITVDRLEIDTTNLDFVAIKVGDVVDTENNDGARFLNKSMGFEIQEQSFQKGELVTVPFIFESESAALGFQLELDFDYKKLAFKGATKDNFLNISDKNFGVKDLEYGHLKMLWVNAQQLPIRPLAKGLFQLEFIALANGNLSSALQFANEQFPAQFYTKQDSKIGLQTIDLTINNAKVEIAEEIITTNPTQFLTAGEGIGDGGCSDGLDNDNDGLIDCADADCFCECNIETAQNLIRNPGAEMGLDTNTIWQNAQGSWEARGSNPDPQDGAAYFYAGDFEVGQLSQIVDLSVDSAAIAIGNVQYVFAGYARSFDQDPADDGQILVEFRNGSDSTVARFDSGLITSPSGWQLITDTIAVPAGTVTAIVNLIARRKNGNNNDAYFDNLSLTRIISDICVDPCQNVALITVATNAVPNSVGGTATATLSGANGPVNYTWSNGDSTANISDLTAGTIMVEASDSIGCTAMETIEITTDSSFFVSFITTPNACNGDTNGGIIAEVSGGTAPFTFNWQDTTLIGDTLMNLANGTYSLTVIDSTGASVSATATVESGANIQFNMTDSKIVDESCPSVGDGQLSLVAEGGTAPYIYILNGDTTNNGVYLGLNAGNYAVTIEDAAGCFTVSEVTVGNTLSGTLSADFAVATTDTSVSLTATTQDTTATYAWTFGDGNTSTETNPTFAYAAPGTYEICLTVSNPCGNEMTCQTVTIGIGGPVRFILNDLNGIANDTVIVPVTVENFIDIVSYQKTIQLQDTTIARIIGVSDPNLTGLTMDNFFQPDPFTVTTVWFDATSTGETLPNNTVLYNLMVMIDSQVDTCVGLSFVESPVASQVVGIMIDEVAEVPYELVDSEICTSESSEVTGTIVRETGSAVPGVTVNVSNFDKTPTTNIDGDYLIEKLPLGNEYEITPVLNTPLLESVSTFDIVLINRHILGTRILDSPYKIIAADINQSETITVFDLVLIQRAILGLNTSFPGNSAWRFIPTSYQFPDPLNPFSEVFPESITVTTNGEMLNNQDFVAVKVADVSYNVPALAETATPRSGQKLTFNVTDKSYKAGDLVTIPVSAKQLNDFAGFQLELDFDKNELAFVGIKTVDLPAFDNNNVGVQHLDKGKLQMIWVAPNLDLPTTATTLFNVQFKAKSVGSLSKSLQLGNRFLAPESYTDDVEIGKLALNFNDAKATPSAEFTVYPNPTKGTLDLSFENTDNQIVQLSLYNFTGQLVKEWRNITNEKAQLDLSNHADGTYMLVLRKGENVEVQTVILNR